MAPDKEQSEINLMYFRNLYSEKLHTCYCFDLPSKIALSTVANLVEVRVGLLLEYIGTQNRHFIPSWELNGCDTIPGMILVS